MSSHYIAHMQALRSAADNDEDGRCDFAPGKVALLLCTKVRTKSAHTCLSLSPRCVQQFLRAETWENAHLCEWGDPAESVCTTFWQAI